MYKVIVLQESPVPKALKGQLALPKSARNLQSPWASCILEENTIEGFGVWGLGVRV